MTSSNEIRRTFTDFFAERGHTNVSSGPLLPPNDDTLMFANAGMVQFKDVFTGRETRDYTRATTSQKCIRISGKHNDLENVGVTARHHTFFEMLGNFSFGDYFKEDAIKFGWELLTKKLGLDPERIVITTFGGEKGFGGPDEEAERIWRDVTGFPKERIIRCGAKDNFWQMGDTGPCGPCTELHYSLGTDSVDPRAFGDEPTPEGRGWFELWNLVFMQFDRQKNGDLPDLPAPSVDTGAGLERLAVVLQDKLSNYDTDLLSPLVQLAGEISGKKYGASQQNDDVSMRVIADHARTTAFLISENVYPDKSKANYVLRRVMRRAIRHGHRLGIHEPFLHTVTDRVVDLMGDAYPQLVESRPQILSVARAEEERFRRTLDRGLGLLAENEEWAEQGGKKMLPGPVAFKLYDTYGFPLDLQDVIGEEEGLSVDHEGFDGALAEAKVRSQGSKVGSTAVSDVYFPIASDLEEPVEFVGFDNEEASTEILALIVDGARTESCSGGTVQIITRATPFYGEKGGQAGDAGAISTAAGEGRIVDTQIPVDGLVVHFAELNALSLKVGDTVTLCVDAAQRAATRRNHSATHLLHWALREVVGETVAQKGSLVSHERLRFDYSSTQPLTAEQVTQIEDLVNDAILANTPITTEVLAIAEAKKRGAIGLFGEKYGDEVRVLRIGPSLELCGGTHASATGDIGLFSILAESGVAAGVRRLEAATGHRAIAELRRTRDTLRETAEVLKASPSDTAQKAERLLASNKGLKKDLERLQKELASGDGGSDLKSLARPIDGGQALGAVVPSMDGKALRELADQLRDQLEPAVIVLGAPSGDGSKALLVCSVSKTLTKTFRAGDIIKEAAAIVGGRGGGRPDFAQAGGSDPSKLEDAVAHVYAATGA
ncbi:MAG: alanyl-tRNA synthetase [Polyangiales bacterium]|jgi:alanyl-tRNA synthetase